MEIIGYIRTDFPEKFGIPRQSGLLPTVGKITFVPPYDKPEAFRGIGEYSHLWLLFLFSENGTDAWHPTVRPPRLGGNRRMGVFATRSPFRPNPIGLSSVKLLSYEETEEGPTLTVEGADLLDGTPIVDIKPYLSYADSHPDAVCGFSDSVLDYRLSVVFGDFPIGDADREVLSKLLSEDPRPSYQDDPARVYFLRYKNYEVSFTVTGDTLFVRDIKTL